MLRPSSRGHDVPPSPPSPPTPTLSPAESVLGDVTECESLPQRVLEWSNSRERRLRDGTHVLRTEARAMGFVASLYEENDIARDGFDQSVHIISQQSEHKGKLVVIGVGKSGHIGQKLVATFQSLGIRAVFLHPTEALHGDLGLIDEEVDSLMFITFSGKTQELLILLPHLHRNLPTIILTSHTQRDTCEIIQRRPQSVLLPAPVPEAETVSFGVPAPTTSTTVALAVGDAIALAAAGEMRQNIASIFAKNHPGGAIGAATKVVEEARTIRDLCTPWETIPSVRGLSLEDSLGIDLLRAGFDSSDEWVRLDDFIAARTEIQQLSSAHLSRKIGEIPSILVAKHMMIPMSAETGLRKAGHMVRSMQSNPDGEEECDANSVVAVMEEGLVFGVVRVGKLLEHQSAF